MKKKLWKLWALLATFLAWCMLTIGVASCGFSSKGLEYTLLADETYAVIGIGTCKDTEVIISNSYNEKAVTCIGESAFVFCNNLTNIVIPNGVTSIEDNAFWHCRRLKSIVIPKGVTCIGYGAFAYCESLTNITFKGTAAQWNAIEKGNFWNYNVPAAKVLCLDGEVGI